MKKILFLILLSVLSINLSAFEISNGGGGGPGSDTTAIHIDTSDEFDTATLEGSPNSNDKILIESVGNSDTKRYITIGTLPTGTGMASFDVSANIGSPQTITNGNVLDIQGTDNIVTTASATDIITIGLDAASRTKLGYVDQSVISGAAPTLTATNFTGASGITGLGTVATGVWNGTSITDANVDNDLTISGGTVDNSIIGGSTPLAGSFTTVTATQQIYTASTSTTPGSTTVTLDLNTGETHSVDLNTSGGDIDLTLSNIITGNTYLIEFIQGATEREISTMTPSVDWINNVTPNLTATEDAKTVLGIFKTPSGSLIGNYNDYY